MAVSTWAIQQGNGNDATSPWSARRTPSVSLIATWRSRQRTRDPQAASLLPLEVEGTLMRLVLLSSFGRSVVAKEGTQAAGRPQATRWSTSRRRHSRIRFQLAKIWVTSFTEQFLHFRDRQSGNTAKRCADMLSRRRWWPFADVNTPARDCAVAGERSHHSASCLGPSGKSVVAFP